MKILIVGNGGREHALAFKLAQSPKVKQIYVAPGNAGTKNELKTQNLDIPATAIEQLCNYAKLNQIDLTVIGPETPLAAGIVDLFEQHNLPCFGPNQQAANLEASKIFAKEFLTRHNIPTAQYKTFTDFDSAFAYAQHQTYPAVLKADGLAAGKGVFIANSSAEAGEWLADVFKNDRFGSAGNKVLFEEFLTGEEASYMIITDGEYYLPLPTSQDHKARDNGDLGPNTGGMGAYSPAAIVTDKVEQMVTRKIIHPVLKGLKKEKIKYQGFLYVGLMIDNQGSAKVLEFNCRLGDPETQALLTRLDSDLLTVIENCMNGQLGETSLEIFNDPAITVVMCAKGYPDKHPVGQVIENLPSHSKNTFVFHAGTQVNDKGETITDGGRVLSVTVRAKDLLTASQLAYRTINKVKWQDCYFRTDIGYKQIARLKQEQ